MQDSRDGNAVLSAFAASLASFATSADHSLCSPRPRPNQAPLGDSGNAWNPASLGTPGVGDSSPLRAPRDTFEATAVGNRSVAGERKGERKVVRSVSDGELGAVEMKEDDARELMLSEGERGAMGVSSEGEWVSSRKLLRQTMVNGGVRRLRWPRCGAERRATGWRWALRGLTCGGMERGRRTLRDWQTALESRMLMRKAEVEKGGPALCKIAAGVILKCTAAVAAGAEELLCLAVSSRATKALRPRTGRTAQSEPPGARS